MYDDNTDGSYTQQDVSSGPGSQSDVEYERSYYRYVDTSSAELPEIITNFIKYFRNAIYEGRLFEIQDLYENTFPKLSEDYYDRTMWPHESIVSPIVDDDPIFMILYKELYYRHIYARVTGGPTLRQRFESFFNYCDLFNYILMAETPAALELPDVWLWEIIDEFVYQFQTFTQYRARPKKTPEELEQLGANAKIWSVLCILNVLHSLIEKSNIKKQLEVHASGGDPDSVAGDFGKHSLYKMLGYYSLVGLLRLHSLLGDYYQAIKVLENIQIHKKSTYSSVPACQITMSYYVGFAYMMMRRYADAIRIFSSILLYLQRTKQLFQSRTYQNDMINKQTDQMYHLLLICLVLHPQYVDESIQQVLREKQYHDKMIKMQYGDLAEFESCFLLACPKFLSPTPPPPPTPEVIHEDCTKEAVKYQTQIFMDEVRQQKILPTIRSYLKLYKTLPLNKLISFMGLGRAEATSAERDADIRLLTTHLLCFKHKMKNLVWNQEKSGLDGSFQSGSELDFYIDHDMIHIADTKVATRHADVFIRKILKFEELRRKLRVLKLQ